MNNTKGKNKSLQQYVLKRTYQHNVNTVCVNKHLQVIQGLLSMGIMGNMLIPPRCFSFPCPFLSLTGSTPSPSAPAGSRAAESHLSESGCLALCRSAEPYEPETRHTNTQTTPTKTPLSLPSSPSVHNTNICLHCPCNKSLNKDQLPLCTANCGSANSDYM